MSVGWLLDSIACASYHQELVRSIENCGCVCVTVTRPEAPYRWDDVGMSYRKAFPKGSCVVTLGDIDLVQRVQQDQLWTPGVFASVPKYFCSHYFNYLGKHLLNQQYVMLPFGELPRCIDFLVKTLGKDGMIFVRPDSPLKLFTGQVIEREQFEKEFEYLGFNGFPPESIVVASAPQKLIGEWRYVICRGEVIAGSQYKAEGEVVALVASDAEAMRFACTVVATGFEPDPVWILDIGKTHEGTYHVVEVGGFSFAGLYACDKDSVVRHVSRVAQQMHASQQHIG
jgi:hypothetical protein